MVRIMKFDMMQEAASRLSAGRLGLQRMGPLPRASQPIDELDAYRVQEILHDLLVREGFGVVVGHKIGCTTPVMQRFLGISNPCSGGIFDSTIQEHTGSFRVDKFINPGVECEIAIRLKSDLVPECAPFSRQLVSSAVGSVMAAIELVDDRWIDYKLVGTPTLIADDFFGAGCVLGSEAVYLDGLDLSAIEGYMKINGMPVGFGHGTDIMGDPLQALVWLANDFATRGRGLLEGEIVLLGSLVETQWIGSGDVVTIEQSGIGTVMARFV